MMATGWIGELTPERRGWRLGLGIAILVLGVLLLSSLAVASILTVALVGLTLLVGGGLAVIAIFTSDGLAEALVMIILAVMMFITGGALLVDPVSGLVGITTLIGTYLTLSGVARIVIGLFNRRGHWGRGILHGIVDLLLGVLIWARWPNSGLVTVGLFIAIELILIGVSWIIGARAKPQPKPQRHPARKSRHH
jgi:uncharacterized membrane protein HdeD (DUF308 family)